MLLEELRKRKNVNLQIVIGASAILPMYGDVISLLDKDGFKYDAKIVMTVEGGTPIAMAKTAGLGIGEFASTFDRLSPHAIVLRGDRYEILSAAVAAAYLNIPIAHIEGGDVTGTIDESVRHAVTKLAHLHFPSSEKAKKRLIRMGEDPRHVHVVGSPEVEYMARRTFPLHKELINYLGVGDVVDVTKPYIIVMNHPVTTEYGKNRHNTEELLKAVREINIPTIWFWPNTDAGTDEISKAIRTFREKYAPQNIRFMKYLPTEDFYGLLTHTQCLVGNSSSGIKECSYLGIPVVNIGTRQNGRDRAENVVDAPYRKKIILATLKKQLAHGKYKRSTLYYKKNTSMKIADILVGETPAVQKRFID